MSQYLIFVFWVLYLSQTKSTNLPEKVDQNNICNQYSGVGVCVGVCVCEGVCVCVCVWGWW